MKKIITLILLMMTAVVMCCTGCQKTPETAVVTSKNDGAFEAALENVAEESPAFEMAQDDTKNAVAETKTYTSSVTSMDGNITYAVNVELPVITDAVPVLQVTPHNFTSEEAQQIAKALFGDAEVYAYTTQKSRAEIEEQILSLTKHISDRDYLVEYYGGDEGLADSVTREYENRIDVLEEQYEAAPEVVEEELCDWEFHPYTYYEDPASGMVYGEEYDYTERIKALVWFEGMPYIFQVSNRDASDYRIHSVYAYVDDLRIPEADRVSTKEITKDDETRILETVERILEEMNLGEWVISQHTVDSYMDIDGSTVYSMQVKATPVYNGVEVLQVPQLSNLKQEDSYASNYYFEEIVFRFNGERMTSFEYSGALDVVSVINESVELLSVDEVMAAFENQMALDDITNYQIQGIPEELIDEVPNVTMVEAQVDTAEFGLVRTRIKNNETDFYLVPAYIFSGSYDTIYSDGVEEYGIKADLATINAVDGSYINTRLGY